MEWTSAVVLQLFGIVMPRQSARKTWSVEGIGEIMMSWSKWPPKMAFFLHVVWGSYWTWSMCDSKVIVCCYMPRRKWDPSWRKRWLPFVMGLANVWLPQEVALHVLGVVHLARHTRRSAKWGRRVTWSLSYPLTIFPRQIEKIW